MTSAPISGLSSDAFSSLFQAVGGLRNRRAVAAMLGCLFSGVLLSGLLSLAGAAVGFIGPLLAALLFLVALATGVNAAGLLLMDQARGVPLRSLPDAIVYGLTCIPKLIVLGLALLAVAVLVFIALALVFMVCKIPYLGALLFVVAFPLSVLIAGITVCGLLLCLVLALPAIWEGSGISRAIAQTLTIARTRLIEALLLLAVVGLLCMFVGFIVFGVLGVGMLPTLGLSTTIVGGVGEAMPSVMGVISGFGGGYAVAGGIGAGLLWALAVTLVAQVYLLGLNLVYLRVTEGLDADAAEAALRSRLDDAKRRTAELAAKSSAPRTPAPPPDDETTRFAATAPAVVPSATLPGIAPPAAMPPSPVATACPQCQAACSSEDLFCGVCGHRLQ